MDFLPPEWKPTNDWNSHRPLLYTALLKGFKKIVESGRVIEMGSGFGSTTLIADYCGWCQLWFQSWETSPDYAAPLYKEGYDIYMCDDYKSIKIAKCGLLFIDCAPGEIRKDLIATWANHAEIIVVHDTEPGAEYVYHMSTVLSLFKYRCDCIIEGHPQTTAVSNTYDFAGWKGEYEGFKIV